MSAASRAAVVPEPPVPFDPLTESWPAGSRLWRCHDLARAPNSYNPTGSSGRFRPIAAADATIVPTAYVGDGEQTVIGEGPFHDLPLEPPKHLPRSLVNGLALSPLRCTRDLTLVSLRGHGMRRLEVTQGNLIEPGPQHYPATSAWGQAAWEWGEEADGMIWVSRQFAGGAALILFGDRVGGELEPDGPTLPLAIGRGFELLCDAANQAKVTLVERD